MTACRRPFHLSERIPLYCALDFTNLEHQYELYDYDGMLFIDRPTPEIAEKIRSLLVTSAPAEIDSNTIEVNYSGRDANRWVVSWLKRLAEVVKDATGEITCTITTDDGDPLFEFFRIANGNVIRQRGQIQRGSAEVVV